MQTPKGKLGLKKVDALASNEDPTIQDYVEAVSEYVLSAPELNEEIKKAAQIRLSRFLGRVLARDFAIATPPIKNVFPGKREVSGALRVVKADVSELHPLDGLRLAVEVKPINLAVGRAIWNRFGDIRTFAVNLHLKFPFAVVGGLLTIPTIEVAKSGQVKDTTHLIERAVNRLIRAGGRRNEAEAAHLLEAVGVVVYDPRSASVVRELPAEGSGLRWEEFVQSLAMAYDSRFED
ncbi:MAG: hypothetical protein AB1646_05860 [Thermodesulfobacteriota bacterium]